MDDTFFMYEVKRTQDLQCKKSDNFFIQPIILIKDQ